MSIFDVFKAFVGLPQRLKMRNTLYQCASFIEKPQTFLFYCNRYILEDPFPNWCFLRPTNCFAWNPRKLPWKSAKLFSLNRLQFGKPLHSCRGRPCTFFVLWPEHGFTSTRVHVFWTVSELGNLITLFHLITSWPMNYR